MGRAADIFVCDLTQFLEVALLRNVAFKTSKLMRKKKLQTNFLCDVKAF